MNRLIIIGAGGHGRVVADNALKNGYTEISFIDDHAVGDCVGFPIIGTFSEIEKLNDGKTDFIIGIGNNATRKMISERYDVHWVKLIHPSAQIGINVLIGVGTVVMAGVVVNACTTIGKHCIINTRAVVEHDNVIEDYVHVSPNATLGGTVRIGENSHIGIGSVIRNNTDVCADCVIGAGTVVVKDVVESGTYVGVPARRMI